MSRAHLLLAAALVAAVGSTTLTQTREYRARLSVVAIDLAMQATVAGSGSVTATLSGTTLKLTGTFQGLKSPATEARLHRGQKTAMRGPAIGELEVSGQTSGTISAAIELTEAQVNDLSNGRLYVQLHSEKAPDGNLWGWLLTQEGKKP